MTIYILITHVNNVCILFLRAFNVERPLVFSGEDLELLFASRDILCLVFPVHCWFLGHWYFPELVDLGTTWPNKNENL